MHLTKHVHKVFAVCA